MRNSESTRDNNESTNDLVCLTSEKNETLLLDYSNKLIKKNFQFFFTINFFKQVQSRS